MGKRICTLCLAAVLLLIGVSCNKPGVININGAVLSSIAVTPEIPSLPTGASHQFTATGTFTDNSTQNVTNSASWTSSDTSKAAITDTGLATAIATGTVVIKASLGSIASTLTLTVTPQTATLTSIAITPANSGVAVGATQQLTATGTYSDATTQNITGSVIWSSLYAAKASISSIGLVTGIEAGATVITARSGAISGSTILTVTSTALPEARWARTVADADAGSHFSGVSVAPDGSVYAAGEISGTGTYDFGNNVAVTAPFEGYNIVLVKYDSSGVAQWARTVAAASSDSFYNGISVTPDGSVYAGGEVKGTGTFDFGDGVTAAATNASNQGLNFILVKYNSSGTAQWARTAAAASSENRFWAVSTGSDGSVYAGGMTAGTGTLDFGSGVTVKGTLNENCLLVKYDSSGTAQWARTAAVESSSEWVQSFYTGVSVASDGSVYAAGWTTDPGTFDFGSGVSLAQTVSGYNMLLVKYDGSGSAQWAKTATVTGTESPNVADFWLNGVSAAPDGSVYIAGAIFNTATFYFGNNVAATGAALTANSILVKFSSEGVAQWARPAMANDPGNQDSDLLGVFAASDGSVYAAGQISGSGTYDFGNSVSATGASADMNILLVKYDSSGFTQWAKTAVASQEFNRFWSVSVASDGSIYAGGEIAGTGTLDFGDGVTAAGVVTGGNTLLVKYQ